MITWTAPETYRRGRFRITLHIRHPSMDHAVVNRPRAGTTEIYHSVYQGGSYADRSSRI